MKKESFYKVLILLLLLIDLGIIAFLWLHHPHYPGPPDKMIIERLKLDADQQSKFDVLKHEHHEQIVGIDEQSADLHRQLFDLLKSEPVDTASKNLLLMKIKENDSKKEVVTFEHFQKLLGILRPDQKPLFDDLIQELSRQLMHQPDGPPRDR